MILEITKKYIHTVFTISGWYNKLTDIQVYLV